MKHNSFTLFPYLSYPCTILPFPLSNVSVSNFKTEKSKFMICFSFFLFLANFGSSNTTFLFPYLNYLYTELPFPVSNMPVSNFKTAELKVMMYFLFQLILDRQTQLLSFISIPELPVHSFPSTLVQRFCV